MKKFATFALAVLILLPAAGLAQSFSTTLTGAAEVPGPGDTDGSGFAVIAINGTTINWTILVQNIAAPTLAHIHVGAANVSGNIVVNFNPTFVGGLAAGSVTADQSLINQIVGNPAGYYVNVHNADFPNGAVRGQLSAAAVSPGSNVSYLPVAGKVAGAAGTNFVSDLRIVNRGSATANVTLEFFGSNPAGLSAPTATSTVSVAPGAQAVINDLIARFSGVSGLGAVRIASDQPVDAISRIINDLRSAGLGTAGFAFDAVPLAEADMSGVLPFLSSASNADIGTGVGFRTNVGYFNPNSTPATVTFTAHRTADGVVLGTNTVQVPGLSHLQQGVFQLLSAVPEADRIQPDYYITWTSSSPIFVYASITDNKTGDGVFVD